MAPKAAPAPSPSGGAGSASDDSVSPTGSVKGRQQKFLQALSEASSEALQQKKPSNNSNDAFPYGITVPFKVRDAVPGDKVGSARVFLAEAPLQALKDMCMYLEMEETGTIDDLVTRITDYFVQLFPEYSKASAKSSRSVAQQKLASAATPMQRRLSSGGVSKALTADSAPSDMKARLTELGKPTYGSRETLWKNLQKAEAEHASQNKKAPAAAAAPVEDKKKRAAEEESKQALKKVKTKDTDKMQKQYCVAGLSIAAQMRMAMEASISSS